MFSTSLEFQEKADRPTAASAARAAAEAAAAAASGDPVAQVKARGRGGDLVKVQCQQSTKVINYRSMVITTSKMYKCVTYIYIYK